MGKIIDTTGQIFNGIKVLKELGHGQVLGQCIHCNKVDTFSKPTVIAKRIRSCGCIPRGYKSKLGQTFGTLKIIEELANGQVKCECQNCKNVGIYNKIKVVNMGKVCTNCGQTFGRTGKIGETYGGLTVMQDLQYGKIICKCVRCGYIAKYYKHSMGGCKNCAVEAQVKVRRIEGHTILNIKVIRYEYKGRDNNYYYVCECIKCGEELLLNYNEIFAYRCDKEQ